MKVGEFPLGLRSQQFLILDIHELTIEAIIRRDRELLVRALAMDPLVNSIATARVVIDELFEREKEALPGWPEREAAPEPAFSASPAARKSPQLY